MQKREGGKETLSTKVHKGTRLLWKMESFCGLRVEIYRTDKAKDLVESGNGGGRHLCHAGWSGLQVQPECFHGQYGGRKNGVPTTGQKSKKAE